MRFLSVCSGVEAASLAWRPLGWRAVAFSEIEPFPCAVLAHHYPDTPNWGDMTKFKDWPDVSIDLLCGGTPCQSFSVAGLRKGLADPRGNLMLTFGAIAAKYRPRWLVWENVPGVISSNGGRDFADFLGLITGQHVEVPLGGWQNSGIVAGIASAYGAAYRVLDAQYVRVESHPRAVPQRRRRVFVVGHLGDWRRAAAVLFERESLSGHPAPRREAGKGLAASVVPSLTASGRGVERTSETRGQDPVVAVHIADVAPTLNASFGSKLGLEDQHIRGGVASSLPDASQCLTTGTGQRYDPETETLIPTIGGGFDDAWTPEEQARDVALIRASRPEGFDVAHALTGEGFDASEDGTGRGTPLIPIDMRQASRGATMTNNRAEGSSGGAPGTGIGEDGDPSPTISTSHIPAVAFAATDYKSGTFDAVDIAGPLTTSTDRTRAAPIAFSAKDHGADAMQDCSPTLRAGGHANSHANAGVMPAVALALRGRDGGATVEIGDEVGNALRASGGGGDKAHVFAAMQVRRLTPRECERLQGFTDDYSLIPYGRPSKAKLDADFIKYQMRGNPKHLTRDDIDRLAKDGPRYKAIGNSWAIPCIRWIGERIEAVESISIERQAA